MDRFTRRLNEAVDRHERQMWSNFLITINTNVTPLSIQQRVGMTIWLKEAMETLFADFGSMNGIILKPAGSPNDEMQLVPEGQVVGVRVKVTIEQGKGRGFMHCHVLLEVCHTSRQRNQWGMMGIHLNRRGLQEYLDHHIDQMPVMANQRPEKCYVNMRLLTRGTDNSNKWLTLEYLDKDRDVSGRNLKRDRQNAPEQLREVRQKMLDEGEDYEI